MNPGCTLFTRMRSAAYSSASVFDISVTAPLDAW